MRFTMIGHRGTQCRKQLPDHGVVSADSEPVAQIHDPRRSRIGGCVRRRARQVKHERVKGIAEIRHRIAAQIINRSHSLDVILRAGPAAIKIQGRDSDGREFATRPAMLLREVWKWSRRNLAGRISVRLRRS